MSTINAGIVYEKNILNIIRPLQTLDGLMILNEFSGGFSAHGSDLELLLKGDRFNVEVKKDLKAQMGGGIIDYDFMTNELIPKGSLLFMDEIVLEKILELAETKIFALNEYISYIENLDENFDKYNPISGIPIKANILHRAQAKEAGLLKNINGTFSMDTSFIENHYNSKNIYYIQIGGAGLFYMGKNPNNLPIPRLEGIINIEFRLGYSGTKYGLDNKYRAANLRAQARMVTTVSSPYTLDDKKSIEKLLNHL